jgi:hypothetical protein
MRDFGVRF